MKICAYSALHYGREYLHYAIRSIIDDIDEYHVFYCPEGSHGHRVDTKCPETRDELYTIAQGAAGNKLHWHDGDWTAEGKQREMVLSVVPDADAIIVLDADEIWPQGAVRDVLANTAHWHRRGILMPLYHYWRSFYHCVVNDMAMPVRVIYPQVREERAESYGNIKLHHFGYAQSPEITRYKWLIHGHRPELRAGWFDDVFMTNRQTDCHPTNVDFWNPVAVDPWKDCGLPEFMREHPYAKVEVIE